MFSVLRPSLVYNVNRDIADHDDDTDAQQWSYNGQELWRGSLDVSFREYEVDVFWLYNDTSECIGLAEHDSNDHSIFKTLFYKDSSFETLFQEEWTKVGTLWSMLSPEAYQDFLNSSIEDIVLASNTRLITPTMLIALPDNYECTKCQKKSFNPFVCTDIKKKPFGPVLNPIFIDESYIVYKPSTNSTVWSILQADASPSQGLHQYVGSQEHPEQSALEVQTDLVVPLGDPNHLAVHPPLEQIHSQPLDD
jgi:hypothetical protein